MATQQHWVNSNGVNLYVTTEGPAKAPPLVLVHGYPDNHTVWDKVSEHLTDRYFVIRYDVRGAGRSDKPPRTRDYRMNQLAGDLAAVVDAVIPDQPFHLAAHDWGSIQSWESVTGGALKPRILSYTSISGPCLDHVAFWLRRNVTRLRDGGTRKVLGQLASSWYVAMFQLPLLPEALWRAGLDRVWPDYLRKQEQVREAAFDRCQRDDGRFGVKLYRANFLPRLLRPQLRQADCPVQLIVPTQDNYVGEQLFEDLGKWVGKLSRRDVDAPHWVLLTQPDAVAGWIDGFAQQASRS
ncbi:alpha/beta fold hydrolase [Marinobacter lipolyticus]|mgnify:CR=1 FL=1|uniref:alpha/beta fold hydrolase n=1 Tax=Marinobacter lipolyticus TaxID=209639 RepID=UPI001BCC0052|nr:alpha/beta fold hydrolase [Marinobacter lipolyticus]MBS8240374.1 alpha/beta fold hydrolase [Marinobacter lipolyticus]